MEQQSKREYWAAILEQQRQNNRALSSFAQAKHKLSDFSLLVEKAHAIRA